MARNGFRSRILPRVAVAALVLGTGAVDARAAGDVEAAVSNGTLTVKGDDESNSILISPLGAGSYQIDGTATTINGGAGFTANGVTGDVKITMNDGDDLVIIEDTNVEPFPDDLVIRTGRGNDDVDMNDYGTVGDAKVSSDDGNDSVIMQAGTIGGKLTVKTGSGTDTFSIESGTVNGRTTVSTGGDDDGVFSNFAQTFTGRVTVRAGSGEDTVQLADTTTGDSTRINCGSGVADTGDVSDPGNSFATPPTVTGCELP